jgi:uracil-DNA glycosylase
MEREDIREEIERLARTIRACTKCPLHMTRATAVPGDGSSEARIMFVGEGPGSQEDREGIPFVGAAGRFLNELLAAIGLDRREVFITNVVKCRPPKNRDPEEGEKKACLPYLRRQVSLIRPAIICTLGNHALRTLVGGNPFISHVHGSFFTKGDYTFFATYHPAAALYNQKLKTTLLEDFAALRKHVKEHELLFQPMQSR